MSFPQFLEQWGKIKGLSLRDVAQRSSVEFENLENLREGTWDPPLSVLTAIAASLDIPVSWLFIDPLVIQRLWSDPEEEEDMLPPPTQSPDPVLHRVIQESRRHPELFTLLTSLAHHGDPKLIRAAQVNLQSLLKQARTTTVPWGSRPPGHFEPPSD